MKGKKVLIVDDEEIIQITLRDAFLKEGYEVNIAGDAKKAENCIDKTFFDLIMLDLRLPKGNGIDLLKKIKEVSPQTVVIVITAFGTIESAVQATKLGAYDYITKPFLIEDLLIKIQRAFEFQSLSQENILLKEELEERFNLGKIIGKNKQMQEIYHLIETVAPTDSTVLIWGESGTGKELVAEAIHHLSLRKEKPMVKVSCAALPQSIMESELFGHEKGAFTGAVSRRLGRFELADGGSLFLDDVDDMNFDVQVKLLRILQEGEFERVGGTETLKVNVRLIAASKDNLFELVQKGFFREDLYYRLNIVSIALPPLRERTEDIPLLTGYFIKKYCEKVNVKEKGISRQGMMKLIKYHWPGNVRELENVVEKGIILSPGDEFVVPSLEQSKQEKPVPVLMNDIVKEAEKEHLKKTLEITDGRKGEAAKILGISRKTLWEKMKLHNLK